MGWNSHGDLSSSGSQVTARCPRAGCHKVFLSVVSRLISSFQGSCAWKHSLSEYSKMHAAAEYSYHIWLSLKLYYPWSCSTFQIQNSSFSPIYFSLSGEISLNGKKYQALCLVGIHHKCIEWMSERERWTSQRWCLPKTRSGRPWDVPQIKVVITGRAATENGKTFNQ